MATYEGVRKTVLRHIILKDKTTRISENPPSPHVGICECRWSCSNTLILDKASSSSTVWFPTTNRYRVLSMSNCGAFVVESFLRFVKVLFSDVLVILFDPIPRESVCFPERLIIWGVFFSQALSNVIVIKMTEK